MTSATANEGVMQPTKAQKTAKNTTSRPTEEPQPPRQRINAVSLSNGASVTSYTNDDTSEDQPRLFNNGGYDETQLHENPTTRNHTTFLCLQSADDKKGPGAKSQIVAKGYTAKTDDEDCVASPPMFTALRRLLALQIARPNWV